MEKASIAKASGSGSQGTNGLNWKLSPDSKRSIDGFPQNEDILLKTVGSSFHSVSW